MIRDRSDCKGSKYIVTVYCHIALLRIHPPSLITCALKSNKSSLVDHLELKNTEANPRLVADHASTVAVAPGEAEPKTLGRLGALGVDVAGVRRAVGAAVLETEIFWICQRLLQRLV